QDGHNVHVLVYPKSNLWRLKEHLDDIYVHEVDLADIAQIQTLLPSVKPDWIFHLAVHGAYSHQTDAMRMVQTNIIGTINLLESSLQEGFEVFVNTGSSSEYGYKDHAPNETEWIDPNSYYAVTKASATLYCRYTANSRSVKVPTLRLYSVYGPYEEPTRLMPTLIRQGLEGKLPPLVNPDTARDYVYIDDVCDAYLFAASQTADEFGPVFNVGTGVQTSLRQLVTIAKHVLNIPAEPNWGSMAGRHWDTTTWVANSQKIRTVLGWKPQYPIEAGFQEMVNWAKTKYESI
ncbi:MAG: NAD-dependent epimerase/dehydratase family protein, partial [Symploca sp. SIO2G7]|nr:NAD-dependent epimerase/dehydratase family protein [Symploca sp. SIO2G7]